MKSQHANVTRRSELLALISDGSTDDTIFKELKELNDADASAKKAWSDSIQAIVEMMAKSEPSIEIADLINASPTLRPTIGAIYDIDAFMAGAKAYGLSTVKVTDRSVRSNITGDGSKPKDLGIAVLVIKVPKAKGQPTTIYQNTPLPADTSGVNKLKNSFVYVKGLEGSVAVNLRKLANADAREFLSTVEGDQFIDKWSGWISRGGKRR
jgi:hypothetical protein